MLIALMTILFLGGGGGFGPMIYIDDAISNTKVAIEDKDRRKEVKAGLKAINKRSKAYLKDTKALSKEVNSRFADHDAATAEVDAMWDQFFALNETYGKDFIELRFEVIEKVSEEEWNLLFPAQ